MKLYKTQRGFTLIDILISAAIVSLLSSTVLFQVAEAKKKANDSHMKVEVQQIASAVELYKNDHNGSSPLTVHTTRGKVYFETDPEYTDTMQVLVDGGYMPQIPRSPDGQSYTFVIDQNDHAFFAFKLKQGAVSSNTKNRCSVTVAGVGAKTYTGCTNVASCTANTTQDCFPAPSTGNFSPFVFPSACSCNGSTVISTSPDTYPTVVCANRIKCVSGFGSGTYMMVPNEFQNTYSCTYTVASSSAPTCDGSSTGDYCQCI